MRRAYSLLFSMFISCACNGDDGPPDAPSTGSSSSGDMCDVFHPCATDSTAGGSSSDTTDLPDLTMGAGDDDGNASTSGGATGDECQASADCDSGLVCVAPFDPELGVFGMGDFECVSACVVEMDELRWCADASACCDPEHVCTDRGYCEPPGVEDDTGDGTDAGTTDAGSSGDATAGDGSTGGSSGG